MEVRTEFSRDRNWGFTFFMDRATTRRLVRSPTMVVRESAALQLEERHTEWLYSKPVVAFDIIWNLAFVVVASSVLLWTIRERPATPIRVWIVGYALQCLMHVGFVSLEYKSRRRRTELLWMSQWEEEEQQEQEESRQSWIMMKLESMNAMISVLWWALGFYWIVLGGQVLLQDAPRLYWLTVVLLAFDVFFAIFCIFLACVIGIALCCCLPCIRAIMSAVMGQEGASDTHLSTLPRFRFRQTNQSEKFDLDKEQAVAVAITALCSSKSIKDLALAPENSECCICLSQYEDGAELHSLPCNHHFHSGCIVKWLRINATCPLCKYNILMGNEQLV